MSEGNKAPTAPSFLFSPFAKTKRSTGPKRLLWEHRRELSKALRSDILGEKSSISLINHPAHSSGSVE